MSSLMLADIAPRLARARDAYLEAMAREDRARRKLTDDLLHKEWLVAHRDLQLARAGHTNNRRYIDKRARKLEVAEQELAVVRDRISHLDDWRKAA